MDRGKVNSWQGIEISIDYLNFSRAIIGVFNPENVKIKVVPLQDKGNITCRIYGIEAYSLTNETWNVDGFKVGLKSIIVTEATHALHNIKTKVVIHLYIKIIKLIKEDGEVFIKPVCQENSMVKQSFSLPGFI